MDAGTNSPRHISAEDKEVLRKVSETPLTDDQYIKMDAPDANVQQLSTPVQLNLLQHPNNTAALQNNRTVGISGNGSALDTNGTTIIGYTQVVNFPNSSSELTILDIQLSLFLIVGVIGNALVLAVFIKRLKRVGAIGHYYNYTVFFLAVGDMVTLVTYIPFYFLLSHRVLHIDVICQLWQFIGVACLWYVHLTICIAIPVERYYAICKPFADFGQREVKVVIGAVAIASLPLASPYGILSTVLSPAGESIGCHYDYTTFVGGTLIPLASFSIGVATFLLPFILYFLLFLQLFKMSQTFIVAETKASSPTCLNDSSCASDDTGCAKVKLKCEVAAKFRVALMLFGVTLVYIGCYMPYFLGALGVMPFSIQFKTLFFINSATNFLVYGALNRTIRREMKVIIWAFFPCKMFSSKPVLDW